MITFSFFSRLQPAKVLSGLWIPVMLLMALLPEASAQCPPILIDSIRWDMQTENDAERMAIIQGIRSGFVRYCEIADLIDPATGQYSEDKGREFLQLFRGADRVFNDLNPKAGEHISPEVYRDKVYQNLYSYGVRFQLKDARILGIGRSESYILTTVRFTKRMFNGVDEKNRYIHYAGKKPVDLPLHLEIRLIRKSDGSWDAVFGSLRNLSIQPKRSSTRTLAISAGGLFQLATAAPLAAPWLGEAPIGTSHPAFQTEIQYRGSFGVTEQWNWLVGAGLRKGGFSGILKEPLTGSVEAPERQIGNTLFSIPFGQTWSMPGGTEIGHSYLSAFIPVGVRYIPKPSLYAEWVFDAQLLGGVTLLEQYLDGNMDLRHGYDGQLDCAATLAIERGNGTASQTHPFAEFRLSAGYHRSMIRLSSEKRSAVWFVRADLGYGILPLFRSSSNTPWATLEDDGSVTFDPTTSILFRSLQTANTGLQAGILWKFF